MDQSNSSHPTLHPLTTTQPSPKEKEQTMSTPSNIVVIGGGIVGSSIAWHLSHSNNTHVTVLASELGGVATPNSFAWINSASDNEKFYYDFRYRSMKRWAEIAAQVPDLPLHWGGSLNWDKDEEELEAYLENHEGWGYGIVKVERSEIEQAEPQLGGGVVPEWGLRAFEEGTLEAAEAARGLLQHAGENFGAEVIEGQVESFLHAGGNGTEGRVVRGVRTSEGREIFADHVVLAAGLGSVPLLAAEGIALPLEGRDGMLVNSKPTKKKFLDALINDKDLHMRQTIVEGRIRAGADYTGGDVGDDPQETAEKLFAQVQASLVDGDELEFDYYTIGTRPDPEDGLPILGPVTGLAGLTVAVMHSGVTNAAIVGELLSKQILTGESDPALEHFRFDRFGNATRSKL
jgi:glycine/D-amino acid oxidase-like deaminating enzyme